MFSSGSWLCFASVPASRGTAPHAAIIFSKYPIAPKFGFVSHSTSRPAHSPLGRDRLWPHLRPQTGFVLARCPASQPDTPANWLCFAYSAMRFRPPWRLLRAGWLCFCIWVIRACFESRASDFELPSSRRCHPRSTIQLYDNTTNSIVLCKVKFPECGDFSAASGRREPPVGHGLTQNRSINRKGREGSQSHRGGVTAD